MTKPNITVDENPDPSLRDAILKPLKVYNDSKAGPMVRELLAVALRDPKSDAVVGGLWGWSVAGWLHVDMLVVPEGFRSQGLGTQLLQKAESVARKRGCVGIWLQTATFQAPGFYQKLGFKAFGTIPDYPPGHDSIYYMKRLDA